MKFGTFYEHQLARPWAEGEEQQLFSDALEQIELADRLGFDYVWEVEHHFLEEYSHSSAPEVFLAAASQRTRQIRLGHGVKLSPPPYNHPARVAEALATLDLVSGGRVEWGTGESSSRTELEGFGIDPAARRNMWTEAVRETARMLAMTPYPGYRGEFFSMPPRDVVPKPVQRPHPPLWVACSNRQTIKLAAKHGLGVLAFSFLTPEEARSWVDEYDTIFARDCRPLGLAVNPQIAMVAGFGCHDNSEEAARRFRQGFHFFQFALGYYYLFGKNRPGESSIWEAFEQAGKPGFGFSGIQQFGDPATLRDTYRAYEDAGVDAVIFVQQGGRNRHDHICEALDLFGAEVMPEFKERDASHAARKSERLAPFVEAALARKKTEEAERPEHVPAGYIVEAYGLQGFARSSGEQDGSAANLLSRAPGVD